MCREAKLLPEPEKISPLIEKPVRRNAAICADRPFPTGLKLMICMGLSIGAFATRTPSAIGILFLLNIVLLVVFRRGPITLRREIKVLCWQVVMITGLYVLRFGFENGIVPGILTSLQLFLAFFPGVIFIQTTPQTQIVMTLEKIMPCRAAFVLAMSIKFVPLMIREVQTIYEAQVFRGAKILPKDLVNPRNWKDLMHCLLFPAIVHGMVTASEIATAARAREFGRSDQRTNWPGA
jgi:energy-coupling factor transport system permease protein